MKCLICDKSSEKSKKVDTDEHSLWQEMQGENDTPRKSFSNQPEMQFHRKEVTRS